VLLNLHPLPKKVQYPNAHYFVVLLCQTPDDFTCQEESAQIGLIRQCPLSLPITMCPVYPLNSNVPHFIILLCLMPRDFTCEGQRCKDEIKID
jgi:hypothetical protein